MRMFEWKPDMVRFMRDASEHTDYDDRLAARIVDAVGGEERASSMRVCDAGCGLGYLSLALARRFAHVTAVDIAKEPLDVLRENILARGIRNIDIHQADVWTDLNGAHFDLVVFCMFGAVDMALKAAEGCAEGIIMIKKRAAERCFALRPGEKVADPMEKHADALAPVRDRCTITPVTLRLDQPIRSLADGVRFFELYGARHDEAKVTEQEALAKMRVTGDREFPFVIPARRNLSIIRITPQKCG